MDRAFWLNKTKASAIHLSITTTIFLVFLYLLIIYWYPLPYFHSDGGWQGMRIMLFVDVVLGPTLTFIVYNHKKTRNKIILDLSVIGIVQFCALIWGVGTVYLGRPVVIAFHEGYFYSQEARGFSKLGIDINQIKGEQHPPIVVVRPVKNREDGEARIKLYNKGYGELQIISAYGKVADNLGEFFVYRDKSEKMLATNKKISEMLASYLDKKKLYMKDLIIVPYFGKYSDGLIIFDKVGNYVDTLVL